MKLPMPLRLKRRLRRWDRRHIWGRDMVTPEIDRCLICPAIRKHQP